MRFFRNRAVADSERFEYGLRDSNYEPDIKQINVWRRKRGSWNECAGNESTPIKRLPVEMLERIFERRMDSFKLTYEDIRHEVGDRDTVLLLRLREEEEDRYRTIFLHSVGSVCRQWLPIAGSLACQYVLVDGFTGDYERAIVVLGTGFRGVTTEAKGLKVRSLRMKLRVDNINKDSLKKLITLIKICRNAQKLHVDTDGDLTAKAINAIWKMGIADLAPSLRCLSWNVDCSEGKPLGLGHYLADMSLLTELEMGENDRVLDFDGGQPVSLTRLRTYRLSARHSSIMKSLAEFSMPSLVDLSLQVGWGDESEKDFDDEAFIFFLSSHGKALRTLELKSIPCRYTLFQTVLDNTPCLEQLSLNIGSLIFNDNYLRHNNLLLLKITGTSITRQIRDDNENNTVGIFFANFLKSMLEHRAFPKLEELKLRDIQILDLTAVLNEYAIETLRKWFNASEDDDQIKKLVILDQYERRLTLSDVYKVHRARIIRGWFRI